MDETEFTDLLRRHAGLIHKIAHAYCRDRADREDVVQEIAVQLWRARDRYDERYRQTTWIYRIALNVAISFYRRERRHQGRGQPIEDGELPAGALAADSAAAAAAAAPAPDESADVRRLLACIDGLGPLERALVLLYLDGNDHASIAEVLGISVSNVGTKLGRIKDQLRAALEEPRAPGGISHGAR